MDVRCACGIVKAAYQKSMTVLLLSAEKVPTG
jgi:hypothetical protein